MCKHVVLTTKILNFDVGAILWLSITLPHKCLGEFASVFTQLPIGLDAYEHSGLNHKSASRVMKAGADARATMWS